MSFVNTVEIYGDDRALSMFIEGSFVEYRDDSVTETAWSAFNGHENLVLADLPAASIIGDRTFYNTKIATFILRNNSVATAKGTRIFFNAPIAKGTGYIYVPRALVDSYKAATNWSTYANQFRALEDYTVDGTITGDLDETKI